MTENRVLLLNRKTGEIKRKWEEREKEEIEKLILEGFEQIVVYDNYYTKAVAFLYFCKYHKRYEIAYKSTNNKWSRTARFMLDVIKLTNDCRVFDRIISQVEDIDLNALHTAIPITKLNYEKLLLLVKKLNETNNLDIIYTIFSQEKLKKKIYAYLRKVKSENEIDVNELRKIIDNYIDELISSILNSQIESSEIIKFEDSIKFFYELNRFENAKKYVEKFISEFNKKYENIERKIDYICEGGSYGQKLLKMLLELTKHPRVLKYLI